MPSRDLLESLFEVERMAEALVADARREAAKRIDEAKASAQRSHIELVEEATRIGAAEREAEEAVVKAEFDAVITEYRAALESTRLDVQAFERACETALAEES
jgi:vacuolar-type H+-ATPase subunit H